MTADAVVALAAFVAMEPVTALAHRLVMHGRGWVLHRSHHQRRGHGVEANDWFPVGFAAVVVAAMAAGFNVEGLGALVPVGVGVTLYGAAYALVHDVCIHRRLGPRVPRSRVVGYLDDAHQVHHRTGGAPYGMLLPVVPAGQRSLTRASSAAAAPAGAGALADQPG